MEEIYLTDGIQADPYDERDYIYEVVGEGDLPAKVDLREWAREIENQFNTGSCVANATVSAIELLCQKRGLAVDLSRLFLYYNLREPYANLHGKDTGSYTRDGFRMAREFGVCTESTWEFNPQEVNTKPSDEAYAEAEWYSVVEYRRVANIGSDRIMKKYGKDIDLNKGISEMKDALNQGYPLLFAMTLGKTFYALRTKKKLEDQKDVYKGIDNDSIGGHAMNCVGYDDELGGFIVENSWGNSWGANGYCIIPYETMKKDGLDVWVCTKFRDPIETCKDEKDELLKEVANKEKSIKDITASFVEMVDKWKASSAKTNKLTTELLGVQASNKRLNEEIVALKADTKTSEKILNHRLVKFIVKIFRIK